MLQMALGTSSRAAVIGLCLLLVGDTNCPRSSLFERCIYESFSFSAALLAFRIINMKTGVEQ